jgi:phospholipase/carboxylesterase
MQKSGWTWREASDNHVLESTGKEERGMSTLDGPRLAPQHPPATHLVVLCHGYGSDGKDLIGLAPHWRALLPGAAFVSPNAPERCAMAPSGYQWFPLSRIDPQETLHGAEGASPKLDAFLDAELARLGLAGDKLALVGFSQGAMMSLHVGLRRKVSPAAIVGYSGMLVGPEKLPHLDKPPPVLLLHGDADTVVPPGALFMSASALGAAGVPVQWHMTKGLGHGIDPQGLALGGQFLAEAFSGRVARSGPVAAPFAR